VDPGGSVAAIESDVVKRLRQQGRTVLALDVFQTGAAKAPRAREDSPPVKAANASDDSMIEHQADVAAGGPKFLTFNVTDDAARVQDIVTAIAYASRGGHAVEIYAKADATLWATFAAAVSKTPVTLQLEGEPKMAGDEDYLARRRPCGCRAASDCAINLSHATKLKGHFDEQVYAPTLSGDRSGSRRSSLGRKETGMGRARKEPAGQPDALVHLTRAGMG
jgi:hypothetical protein